MSLIFGRHPVYEALRSDRNIEKIFVLYGTARGSLTEVIKLAKQKRIKIVELSKDKFKELAKDQNTQGIIAKISDIKFHTLDEIIEIAKTKKKHPFLVLLDNIQDPHNLGAIIRTAECFAVDAVIIPKDNSANIDNIATKTSSGAVEYVPLVKVTNVSQSIDELKKNGFWIVGTSSHAEKKINELKFDFPITLVLGNEGEGMRKLTESKCDFLIRIPLYGKIESLNVSVSAAILIYEIRKQLKE